jgi:hypothetical protein
MLFHTLNKYQTVHDDLFKQRVQKTQNTFAFFANLASLREMKYVK